LNGVCSLPCFYNKITHCSTSFQCFSWCQDVDSQWRI